MERPSRDRAGHGSEDRPAFTKEGEVNCTICGKPIVLVPSAKERAAKDTTGKTAAYYTSLFTEHADCSLKKREEETSALMERLRT